MVAIAALHFYTPTTAEVRSLAVDPATKGAGLGRRIVEWLEKEADEHALESIFAFTYVPGFFRKLGFEQIQRDDLPLKTWKDCLRCPKFQACDEVAMLKRLRPSSSVMDATAFGQGAESEHVPDSEPLIGSEMWFAKITDQEDFTRPDPAKNT